MKPPGGAGRIMAVDDEPANLKLLEEMLRQKGYEVRSFPLGRLALASTAHWTPDLILLDINMPELSGYEVCRRLKADPRLCEIPVIFLSALHEADDKVKGFHAGGVDYIPKPFHFEEMYARVETHLQLHDLRQALKLVNEGLEETVAARTSELATAYARLARLDGAKDDFLKIISHELRTPLQGLFGMGEIALDALPSSELNSNVKRVFERSRRRILALLDDALLLTRIDIERENFRSSAVSLRAALDRAMERARSFAESRQVTVKLPKSAGGLVQGEENLLTSALHALLETAVKFSKEGGTVCVEDVANDLASSAAGTFGVIIESEGRAIPSSALPKFFDVFAISEAITPGGDLGLGPPMAARILSLFGSTVTVANRDLPGIRLSVSFPKSPD
jgi:DNA-binding response OmpR family regulator